MKKLRKIISIAASAVIGITALAAQTYAQFPETAETSETAETEELVITPGISPADSISGKLDEVTQYTDETLTFEIELSDEEYAYILSQRDEKSEDETAAVRDSDAVAFTYGTRYYYDRMNTYEKELYDGLYAVCEEYMYSSEDSKTSYIDSPVEYNADYIDEVGRKRVYNLFYLSNPQFFFIRNGFFYNNRSAKNPTASVLPTLNSNFLSASEKNYYRSAINSKAQSWIDRINGASSPLEKQEVIYKLLVDNITYTTGAVNSQSIAGAMVDGKCVCNGYALATEYLCNAVGLECIAVVSERWEENGKETGHAWNIIKLYENWYEFDVTWMDSDKAGQYRTKYLNKSHTTFTRYTPLNAHIYNSAYYVNISLPACLYDEVRMPAMRIQRIEVSKQPVKTLYLLGEDIDVTGGEITAYLYDGYGGYDQQVIPFENEAVTVTGNTNTRGTVTVEVSYLGKKAKYTIFVQLDPGNAPVVVSTAETEKGALDLDDAMRVIDEIYAQSHDKNADYSIVVNKTISCDKLTFSANAGNIDIITGDGISIRTALSSLAAKTSLGLNCDIVSTAGKSITVSVPSGKTLTVYRDFSSLGTVKGTSTGSLVAGCDIKLADIKTFGSVGGEGTITVSDKISGVGRLSGRTVLLQSATASVTELDNAEVSLVTSVSGKIPKFTAASFGSDVTIGIYSSSAVSEDTLIPLPRIGTTVMYLTKAAETDTDGVTLLNSCPEDKELSFVRYSKELRAEDKSVLTLTYGSDEVGFSTMEKLLEYITARDKTAPYGTYTVTLNEDISASKLALPKSAFRLTINGGGHTLRLLGVTSISPKFALELNNIEIVSRNSKDTAAAALTITASKADLGVSDLRFTGKELNIKGGSKTSLTLGSCTVIGTLSGFGTVTITGEAKTAKTLTAAALTLKEGASLTAGKKLTVNDLTLDKGSALTIPDGSAVTVKKQLKGTSGSELIPESGSKPIVLSGYIYYGSRIKITSSAALANAQIFKTKLTGLEKIFYRENADGEQKNCSFYYGKSGKVYLSDQ